MRHMCANSDQYIYREGDTINNIYFLYKGLAGFVLPRHKSYYIIIEEGDTFGVVDIIYDINDNQEEDKEKLSSDNSDSASIDSDTSDEENI